ncbi:MAG: CPBP family intramembrane metalloprotease [Solirubrobacterales bacterium]|nr:CPBP family intramembrane metalloprotease [Solirubrobacterales bacterium]
MKSWPDRVPPWRLWMVPAGIVLGLVLGTLVTILIEFVGHFGGSSLSHPSAVTSVAGDIGFEAAFVAAAIMMASVAAVRPHAADFGFRRITWRSGIAAGLTAMAGYYLVTAIYAEVFSLRGKDKLPSELIAHHSTPALVVATVYVCAVAPMAEETFFRGFVFGGLRRLHAELFGVQLGPWIAALVTALLFGLAHTGSASPQYLVPLGILGFVLCLVRWKTDSLYPGMAMHSANNALALGVNQLHWSGGEVLGLMILSWAVIAAVVGPLAARTPRPA